MPTAAHPEDLAEKQFTKMRNALMDASQIGMTLLTAWIAQGRLRDLLALARSGADREHVGHLRWKFLTWCAYSEAPEVRQLAATLDCWWPEISAFIATGHSNATSEGVNRIVKVCARNTHGFGIRPTSGYAHAASPPAAPEDIRTAQLR